MPQNGEAQKLRVNVSLSDLPDKDLIVHAQAGEEAAFEVLCRRFIPELKRRAASVTQDPDLASECVQQTLIRLHKGLAGFDAARAFRPWLYTILSNTMRSLWIQARKLIYFDDEPVGANVAGQVFGTVKDDPLAVIEGAEEQGEKRRMLNALGECVGTLDADARKLYTLVFEDHLSHKAAAEVLTISHVNCRQRSVRIRKSLRMCVEGKLGKEVSP